jgi:hypothetical protein
VFVNPERALLSIQSDQFGLGPDIDATAFLDRTVPTATAG